MTSIPPQLILASGSPRRASLLREAGYEFEVVVPRPEAECGACSSTGAVKLVQQLAMRKLADVAQQLSLGADGERRVLLAADTVAECQGQILGKPSNGDHARRMLEQMRGREHRVVTGFCLATLPPGSGSGDEPPLHLEAVVTRLRMDSITDDQIDEYLDSEAWKGKAGGFGYQDGLDWVHLLEGSESNVVGLPMERVSLLLGQLHVLTGGSC